MRNVFFSFVALCLLAGRLCAADSLREGFANPPPEYRVHTWYHWSSNFVTPEGITADLEAMRKAGIGTVHLFAAAMSRMPSGPGDPDGEVAGKRPSFRFRSAAAGTAGRCA